MAHLLIVDDDANTLASLARAFRLSGHEATVCDNAARALELVKAERFDVVLSDVVMPGKDGLSLMEDMRAAGVGLPVVMISGQATVEMAVRATRLGAVDFLEKPLSTEKLLLTVDNALKLNRLEAENRELRRRVGSHQLVGSSEPMRLLLRQLDRVAASETRVCILGETGTGKELVARAIHAASPRKHREMVAENFGSVTQTLIESTLFGSKKGAYTGSDADRPGLFEIAHGSTLFLDEIGEATPEVQMRLLRVLEERTVTRIGDTRTRPVDVRLIAATNKDLKQATDEGGFRADLYYRLSVLRIQVPPLRERPEDIEPIANHLLSELNRKQKRRIKGFDRKALEKLKQYNWPGNVRELRNVIEAAVVIYAESETILAEDLVLDRATDGRFEQVLESPYREAVTEFDRRYFRRLLRRANGNKSRAAELAGIDRTNLYKHLERARIQE